MYIASQKFISLLFKIFVFPPLMKLSKSNERFRVGDVTLSVYPHGNGMSLRKFVKRSSVLLEFGRSFENSGFTRSFRDVSRLLDTFLHMRLCSLSSSSSSEQCRVIDMPEYSRRRFAAGLGHEEDGTVGTGDDI